MTASIESLTLNTDTADEAVDSLRMVNSLLDQVVDDSHQWKWVTISLHSALQGFMVLALQGTWPANVLEKDVREQLYREAQEGGPAVREDSDKLDGTWGLYTRIKKAEWMTPYMHSKPFSPNGTQTANLQRVVRLRNTFSHYKPMSWYMFIADLPKAVYDLMGIVWDLSFKCNTITFMPSPEERGDPDLDETSIESEIGELVREIREKCVVISQGYVEGLPKPRNQNLLKLIRIKPKDLSV